MNNWIRNLLLSVVVLALTACTTSKSTISKNINLSKYEYASIINNDTYHIPAELMEYEILLYDAVENSQLKLISDARIYELSPSQQEKLLLVKYGVNVKGEETRAILLNRVRTRSGTFRTVKHMPPEIFVMGIREVRQVRVEGLDTHSCQSAEPRRVGYCCCVTHDNITDFSSFALMRVI